MIHISIWIFFNSWIGLCFLLFVWSGIWALGLSCVLTWGLSSSEIPVPLQTLIIARPMILCPKIKPLKWAYFELVQWTRPNKEKEGRRTVLRGAQLGPSMSLLPHTGQKSSLLFWSKLMKTFFDDDTSNSRYLSWRWTVVYIFCQFVKKQVLLKLQTYASLRLCFDFLSLEIMSCHN